MFLKRTPGSTSPLDARIVFSLADIEWSRSSYGFSPLQNEFLTKPCASKGWQPLVLLPHLLSDLDTQSSTKLPEYNLLLRCS
uniref:Uncharacterized protein n=1 Tax=Triticum urartu TaxID=4572 RepID=A0A8R7U1P6_TRIUA